ncbi:MAG: EamA family transporter [Bacteroidetes bacterium]|nr:EamA family transporter [Bacteroidota bacterium]MBU1371622.1 EamA family transporter [Bacteroidota bacterium]MBU1486198.1 EamA family transporter [Bacteroidota bacterium]MBU1761963.1 EamA family transporter [Bacteroidota bacterium]MBU2046929.1 EamA family transporter [Bacteroidota bacterium]
MIYIIFAIFCSVVVSVNFKLFKRYYTNAYQAIVFNYPTAALFCYFFFKPDLSAKPTSENWLLFLVIAVLLISIFYFIGKSIETSGIVLTSIAQRLSLIIPVISAFLIFGETSTTVKIIGLIIGLIAIYASKPSGKANMKDIVSWYPIIVFLGTGIIDILFNVLTKFDEISFTAALVYIFSISTIIGFASLIYQKIRGTLQFQPKTIVAGMILGVFNFGSIFFYIKALQIESDQPSVVFASLDIGVITLGSLVGIILFKEKLSKLNMIGLVLALAAIIILNLPNAI